ncbi:glucosamine-6-phosphate deaminase [Neokomagataea thailandica]|uniref:Glucosamine-6-phosphate deaminase n=1 Tax=Neokomagataea tanensis NBRC 106556 TaxID=1223519 RepID=A0ABQ0QGK0_9PROT|nr:MULTISPECIES: glucosamine-6-phosphate deaminase [Neokomagataea]GBR43955.1 6-phosphogluconolactonase [Neokomagataea tanensis NBRC 106556]
MKIIILPDAHSVCGLAADIIAQTIRQKPEAVLGLATGRTMEAIYAGLCERHRTGQVDVASITSFNLDEYVGLPKNHPQSYRHYMREKLFDSVGVPEIRGHVPCGDALNPDQEAASYDQAIAEAGGIDLQLLGLGGNGHIGFNEPLSGFRTRTRVVALAEATLAQNSGMFEGDPDQVPKCAITMGVGTILEAKSILLVATGAAKAEAVAGSIEGPLSSVVPGSAVQMHQECLVLLDEQAASGLKRRASIEWQMKHDPELSHLIGQYCS